MNLMDMKLEERYYYEFAQCVAYRYENDSKIKPDDIKLETMERTKYGEVILTVIAPSEMYYKFTFDTNGTAFMDKCKVLKHVNITGFLDKNPYDIMNKPLKVFISQPMRDKSGKEIEETRSRLLTLAHTKTEKGIELIQSYFKNSYNENHMYNLGAAIQLLGDADIVVFAKDWKNYRGCRIEYQCAKEYNKKIIIEE